MSFRICPLYSGSTGNATLVCTDNTAILVDAGKSGAKLEKAMTAVGVSCDSLSAIIVTHEHQDHIQAIGILARKYNLDVIANSETLGFLEAGKYLKKVPEENKKTFKLGEKFFIGDIEVMPYKISHDALNPVGFTFSYGGKKFSIATDTGIITEEIQNNVVGSDAVLLEFNHDENMLMMGPYPFQLKKRIVGEKGHLSNEAAADFAEILAKNGMTTLILGHLSKQNNYPDLAYETVNGKFKQAGIDNVKIYVSDPELPGEMTEV